ncbi:MAG: polyprenyl synthetase family protein [bacterium]
MVRNFPNTQAQALIDRELARLFSPRCPTENLHDAALYALGLDLADPEKRGKRVRPILCVQTCQLLGGNPRAAIPFAMAIELMHNFCLVHDDIEDGDTFRRDRPSVWVKYGLPHAINVGDYLLTKVFVALTNARRFGLDDGKAFRLTALIAETLDQTHIGQALDMNARSRRDFSVEEYLQIVEAKTGRYLAAPILGGAIVADAPDSLLRCIERFGQFLGPLFQIIDDIIDLTEGKGRETVGSDIREGKRSYLVAFTAAKCTKKEKARLFAILDKPRNKTTKKDVSEVAALYEKYDAIRAGREYCRTLLNRGRKALQPAPAPFKNYLLQTFEGLIDRKK